MNISHSPLAKRTLCSKWRTELKRNYFQDTGQTLIQRESQNHRDGKDPLEITQSNSLLKQVPCSRKAPRWILNNSSGGDSTTFLGSLFQCSVTLKQNGIMGKKTYFSWNKMSMEKVGHYEVPLRQFDPKSLVWKSVGMIGESELLQC